MIRRATVEDAYRIAEMLVFVKRMKFRPIFQDDDFSFNVLQVIPVAKRYIQEGIIDKMFVYDDGRQIVFFVITAITHRNSTIIYCIKIYKKPAFKDIVVFVTAQRYPIK